MGFHRENTDGGRGHYHEVNCCFGNLHTLRESFPVALRIWKKLALRTDLPAEALPELPIPPSVPRGKEVCVTKGTLCLEFLS